MKRYILFIALLSIAMSISAQKATRKAIREGNKSYREQMYGKAEDEYIKALEVNPGSKEAAYNLANAYYKQQQWDEALKTYEHYLTLENQDPTKMGHAWGNVGNTYLKKKANEKYEQQAPTPQGQQQQGQQGQQQKKKADYLKYSMEAYKNALRLNPSDEEVRYNLAVVQKMIKDQQGDGGGGGGGGENNQPQDQQQDPNKKPNQDPNKDPNKGQDQQQQQDPSQMSKENIEQILKAIEQDEKDTQDRVRQMQARQRQQQNKDNRQNNKDW